MPLSTTDTQPTLPAPVAHNANTPSEETSPRRRQPAVGVVVAVGVVIAIAVAVAIALAVGVAIDVAVNAE